MFPIVPPVPFRRRNLSVPHGVRLGESNIGGALVRVTGKYTRKEFDMQAYQLRGALSSLVAFALVGCASMQVRTDFDELRSFARLGTYDWVDQGTHPIVASDNENGHASNGNGYASERDGQAGAEPAVDSPFVERRIRNAVDRELARIGYQRVTSGTPDFRVAFRVVTEKSTERYYSSAASYGFYPYFGLHGFGHGHLGHSHFRRYAFGPYYEPVTRERLEGTLVLDIIDGHTGELIWRGWATDKLRSNPKPKDVQRYVASAVEKILERFPPTD